MSLHVFGKVMGRDLTRLASGLTAIAAANALELALDQLDVDDLRSMEECTHLRGPGVSFAFGAGGDGGDASRLWIEAMESVRSCLQTAECDPARLPDGLLSLFSQTRLGRVCDGVFGFGNGGGIALVDGGIEDVFVAPRNACLSQIICDVSLTWDQSPNRLYVLHAERLRAIHFRS